MFAKGKTIEDQVIHINRRKMERINDDLDKRVYGWYLDSNGKSKYFLSIYNEHNYSEELTFEIDFSKDGKEIIKEGLRFSTNRGVVNLNENNQYFPQARKVAQYIKDQFL